MHVWPIARKLRTVATASRMVPRNVILAPVTLRTMVPANATRAARKQPTKIKNTQLTGVVFWVCLILILVPIVGFGWILLSSSMDTGTPVLGNRYDGDLDPAITKSQLEEVEAAVGKLSGVENVSVVMPTATLRVYVDVEDSANKTTISGKADEVYRTVTGILDAKTYFTQKDGKKMYDLEVHVYNHQEEVNPDNFAYLIKTKTSNMDDPKSQLVSEPLDAKLAQQLRDDVIAREQAAAEGETGGEVNVESSTYETDEDEDAEGEEGEDGEESDEEEEDAPIAEGTGN